MDNEIIAFLDVEYWNGMNIMIYIYIYNVIENEIIALLDVKYYDGMNIMVYVLICMEDEIIVVFLCWILQWNEYYVVCIC